MKKAFKPLACLLLACLLQAGSLGMPGSALAEGWLSSFIASMKKDAHAGDVEAQLTLGVMYYEGQGVPRDFAQARVWLGMAAEQDSANAQFLLGDMYEGGMGVDVDVKQAISWYQKAAFHHHPEAMYRLGNMFATGKGVQKDRTRAWDLFNKSCSAGYKLACERSRRLTEANF